MSVFIGRDGTTPSRSPVNPPPSGRSSMSTSIRSIVLALVLGAVLAPAAQANQNQMSIMMDDDLLVYRSDSVAARALTQMKALGVDTVRVTVLWETVAEFSRFTKADLAQ